MSRAERPRVRVDLRNTYHGTETYIMAWDTGHGLACTERQQRDAYRRLCGIDGCMCWAANSHPDEVDVVDERGRSVGML